MLPHQCSKASCLRPCCTETLVALPHHWRWLEYHQLLSLQRSMGEGGFTTKLGGHRVLPIFPVHILPRRRRMLWFKYFLRISKQSPGTRERNQNSKRKEEARDSGYTKCFLAADYRVELEGWETGAMPCLDLSPCGVTDQWSIIQSLPRPPSWPLHLHYLPHPFSEESPSIRRKSMRWSPSPQFAKQDLNWGARLTRFIPEH